MNIENAENINKNQKLPVFSTIFGTYGLLIDKFKNFVFIGTAFAVVLMVLYIFSGQAAVCYTVAYRDTFYCSNNFIFFIASRLAVAFILCMFIRNWAQNALAEKKQNLKHFFIPRLADLKIAGGFFIYILALMIAMGSFYLLIVREPSPNWKIEWAYFTVISLGFFAPVLVLRFSVYFAFWSLEQNCPPLTEVWHKTSGSNLSLLSGIFFLLFAGLFISQALLNSFTRIDSQSLLRMIGSEYLSNIALIFIVTCFINYCYLQKVYLYGKDENEKSNNA